MTVDRSPSDQAWAVRANSKTTLQDVVLVPLNKITEANLSDFFFDVFQASKTARLTYYHMSEEELFALFDKVRSKLTQSASAPERIFYSDTYQQASRRNVYLVRQVIYSSS